MIVKEEVSVCVCDICGWRFVIDPNGDGSVPTHFRVYGNKTVCSSCHDYIKGLARQVTHHLTCAPDSSEMAQILVVVKSTVVDALESECKTILAKGKASK